MLNTLKTSRVHAVRRRNNNQLNMILCTLRRVRYIVKNQYLTAKITTVDHNNIQLSWTEERSCIRYDIDTNNNNTSYIYIYTCLIRVKQCRKYSQLLLLVLSLSNHDIIIMQYQVVRARLKSSQHMFFNKIIITMAVIYYYSLRRTLPYKYLRHNEDTFNAHCVCVILKP